MKKKYKLRAVSIICFGAFVVLTIVLIPHIRDYVEARKRAKPIIYMLRQGTTYETIGHAVNAIRGTRFVTLTNALTGIVSERSLRKFEVFESLSPKASEVVQREIIHMLPNVSGAHEISLLLMALGNLQEDGTLVLVDVDWEVVEDAMERFNIQVKPKDGQYHIYVDPDEKKWISLSGPVYH